ncbi:hypothetical protein E4U56_002724 [Claviceps arundinis]|uniref:Uncharacterized protein n=1 Tax=Claviceps arundinis TaxID=1623583 RepID=A0A9P7SPA2_9HYPO|nr:hypothetical protein E4U56_002724 [Claviceps arundinis]
MAPTTRITSLENLLACVEDIDDIRAGKFEPWNLIRLHPVRGQRPSDNKGLSSVDISSGHVTVKKKTHLPSEYASDPLIFVNSFSNYVPKHPDFPELHHRKGSGPRMVRLGLGDPYLQLHELDLLEGQGARWEKR